MNLDYSKLLNRKPIVTDLGLIEGFIKGKRILVTGGAGSIGSEIVRQLVSFGASTVTVFDNAEASMFHLEQEISRSNPNSHIKYVIGDVRDKYRLEKNYKMSDQIRDKLTALGIEIEDSPQGTKWRKT